MATYTPHLILDNHFLLSGNRTIFWEEERALILSDLHIGKSGHFRKNGIGIPQGVLNEDMQRLFAEIQFFNPAKLIIVGDLFHSHSNKEHDLFLRWRNDMQHLHIDLVMGNHDILKACWYEDAVINVHKKTLQIGRFIFMHDSCEADLSDGKYCFSGHIHPGITIRGMGRQSLKLPCFYFTPTHAVLPAFGKFTGTHPVHPQAGDAVFAVSHQKLIQVY